VHRVYNNYANNQLQNKYSERAKEFLKNNGIEL
jgi:hypothetical protein